MMTRVKTKELAAIFCSTFKNVQGTVVAYQYPHNYVSSVQFKEIGNVVIPRAELAFRVITVEAFKHYIIGCFQRIEGVRYQRNTLQFNICLVIKPRPCSRMDDVSCWQFWGDQSAGGLRPAIQAAYEALALKINRYFYSLEGECGFLSNALELTDDQPCSANLFWLDSIFEQLHSSGMCVLTLPNCSPLYLRFSPQQNWDSSHGLYLYPDELIDEDLHHSSMNIDPTDPNNDIESNLVDKSINSYQAADIMVTGFHSPLEMDISDDYVYVLIVPLGSITGWKALDAVVERLLPHLNGRYRLPELAQLAGLDLSIARLCLAQLVRLGLVRALPYPNYLNSLSFDLTESAHSSLIPGWLGLPRLASLLSNHDLGKACLQTVVVQSFNRRRYRHIRRQLSIVEIFRLYAMICASPNISLPIFISANPHIHFIDPCIKNQVEYEFFNPHMIKDGLCRPKLSILRLLQFGELNGLVKRLQCYPISDNISELTEQEQQFVTSLFKDLLIPVRSKILTRWTDIDDITSSNLFNNSHDIWKTIRTSMMSGQYSLDFIACQLTNLVLQGRTVRGTMNGSSRLTGYLTDKLMGWIEEHILRGQFSIHQDSSTLSAQTSDTSKQIVNDNGGEVDTLHQNTAGSESDLFPDLYVIWH